MEDSNSKYNKLIENVSFLLRKNKEREVAEILDDYDFHVIANVLVDLSNDRRRIFLLLPPDIQAEVILLLSKRIKKRLLPRIPSSVIARFLHFTDEDDAADVLQTLPPHIQEDVSSKLQENIRKKIEQLLKFDPETAGGIMDLNFIIVKINFTFQDLLKKINLHVERTKQVPVVVVTDEHNRTLGITPFKRLLGVSPDTSIRKLIRHAEVVPYTIDQEALIEKLKHSHEEIVIVVDKERHPLGIVHPHDLIQVIEEEATEDLYKFAGVEGDENVFDTPTAAVRYRYKWILTNLGTALITALIISLFKDTISSLVILAAYMPIVAGMGGNAGTQTLAVVVRGLALGEVRPKNAYVIIKKEILAGFLNGLIVGSLLAFIVTLLHGNPLLGLILGSSLVINLVVAGLFGALVPLVLKSLKLDPALSSSVFITTATDIFGFFVFLGLATVFLV